MSNLLNSKAGKATPAEMLAKNFFVQSFVTPHPHAPGQAVIHPLPYSGIPMRDYFAAKAMQSLSGYDDDLCNFLGIARDAYRMADAMLKAREEKTDDSETPFNDSQFHGDHLK